jgi:hypothetical protein
MSAFPPVRSLRSIPITTADALQRLQSYLEATKSNPALLPNATLQVDGPKAQSESASNLVIHNLKRVEAGLRGDWLEPSLELEAEGMAGFESFPVTGNGLEGRYDDAGEGWQDLDEYQREQSIEMGEIGPRETGIGQEMEEALPVLNMEAGRRLDKEARKKEKKERLRRERVAKEQAKQERAKHSK